MISPSDLHARVRAFVTGGGEDFDALAVAIARHQAAACAPIARLFAARGVSPFSLARADDIPAVPTEAWKHARIASHPPADDVQIFHTSGTTLGARGAHALRTVETYQLVALRHGAAMLVPDRATTTLHAAILVPTRADAPDSSLGFMCDAFARAFAASSSFHVVGDRLDVAGLRASVERAKAEGAAVLLLATSFALVHLLDALDGRALTLPAGSRAMQTGGFKGKSREVDAGDLRADVARAFALDPRAVVTEYGMTELSSQAYEGTLRGMLGLPGASAAGVLVPPAWMRVRAVDPATLEPLPRGVRGIARIVDLANVDSAVAVQTEDEIAEGDGGFTLFGRLAGATPRGCSIAIDELLGSARGDLAGVKVEWDPRASACVVMVAGGYPGDYEKGNVIDGLRDAARVADTKIFHAGTELRNGKVITYGGRVLGVTSLGETPAAAAARAYEAVEKISWKGSRSRSDIGAR